MSTDAFLDLAASPVRATESTNVMHCAPAWVSSCIDDSDAGGQLELRSSVTATAQGRVRIHLEIYSTKLLHVRRNPWPFPFRASLSPGPESALGPGQLHIEVPGSGLPS